MRFASATIFQYATTLIKTYTYIREPHFYFLREEMLYKIRQKGNKIARKVLSVMMQAAGNKVGYMISYARQLK